MSTSDIVDARNALIDQLRNLLTKRDARIAELESQRKRLQSDIRRIAVDIMDHREYDPCWYTGRTEDSEDGDCGNWDECDPHCSLRELMDMAGITPQEDGGCDRQSRQPTEDGKVDAE